MRILIVEDEPICSLILTKCLQSVGEIQTAADGEAGVDHLRFAAGDRKVEQAAVAVEKEIKTSDGDSHHRMVPTLSGQAYEILAGMVDIMVYYKYELNGGRTLIVKGSDSIAAGTRTERNFLGITKIPGGRSPQEAYSNFVKAFNNNLVVAEKPAPITRAGMKIK